MRSGGCGVAITKGSHPCCVLSSEAYGRLVLRRPIPGLGRLSGVEFQNNHNFTGLPLMSYGMKISHQHLGPVGPKTWLSRTWITAKAVSIKHVVIENKVSRHECVLTTVKGCDEASAHPRA